MSPTTPIYQLPYPAAADPADVPLDIQELAERIEVVSVPLFALIDTQEIITATAFTDAPTPGPSITLPRAGDYIFLFGFMGYHNTAGGSVRMSLQIGATPANDTDGLRVDVTGNVASPARAVRKTGLTPVTVTAKYRTNTGQATIAFRWLIAVAQKAS